MYVVHVHWVYMRVVLLAEAWIFSSAATCTHVVHEQMNAGELFGNHLPSNYFQPTMQRQSQKTVVLTCAACDLRVLKHINFTL